MIKKNEEVVDMAELKKEVQSLLKNLKSLTKQTERLAKKVDTASTARPKKAKAKKKAAKKKTQSKRKTTVAKKTRVPASDVVYQLIRKSKKGSNTANLIKKTGYKEKKIRDIIYRLKKQNKIKSAEKGVYVDIA